MCLAIPGRIVTIDERDPATRCAQVDFDGIVKTVQLLYLPEARTGDFVLVHAGFATQRLPEAEAREALRYARTLSEMARSESAPAPSPEIPPLREGVRPGRSALAPREG
ncbi:MAG: HypC/HybG/HupF family hydrogenase formation chaperone [Thermoplasmata archaeon]